jgi:hypothetical protein
MGQYSNWLQKNYALFAKRFLRPNVTVPILNVLAVLLRFLPNSANGHAANLFWLGWHILPYQA